MMPTQLNRICGYPGCGDRRAERWGALCDTHGRERDKAYDADRNRSDERRLIRSGKWAAYSRSYRRRNALCVRCLADTGRAVPSEVVDHIEPHKGDIGLFWRISNHQALCKRCHDIKTATEDGRWNG